MIFKSETYFLNFIERFFIQNGLDFFNNLLQIFNLDRLNYFA